jgi:hypothetical protein
MHASTAGLVTCCGPKCSQPATVTVPRCRPPEEIKLAVDGSTYLIEHDPVDVDYCTRCADRFS